MKRYIANCSDYSISLSLEDGRNILLKFEGKDTITKQRFADIEDPMIQKALEATPSFNVYFEKSNEFDWMQEGDQVPEHTTIIPGTIEDQTNKDEDSKDLQDNKDAKELQFDTLALAKKYLLETHSVPFNKAGTRKYVDAEFAKLGISVKIK